MDATRLLKAEHDALRALLARLLDEAGVDQRREQVRDLAAAWLLHAQMEERFVYRALEERGDAEADQRLTTGRFEHARLEDLIERVVTMDGRDAEFERAVGELERTAVAHLREEEARLFPLAERLIEPMQRLAIGRAMAEWRGRLDRVA